MWKGCRQGAPESPALWTILLDEVLGRLIRSWPLPWIIEANLVLGGTAPGGSTADDFILIAKRESGVREMSNAMQAAARALGPAAKDDKAELRSHCPGQAIMIAKRRLAPVDILTLLGSPLLGMARCHQASGRRRVGEVLAHHAESVDASPSDETPGWHVSVTALFLFFCGAAWKTLSALPRGS